MAIEKIDSEVKFIKKLDEIGQIFGVKFELRDKDVFMTNESGKTIKMANKGDYYYGFLNGKKIYMSYIYVERCFTTSVMIEVFSNDGKRRDCCHIEQELTPQSGIRAYPTFTFTSYQDGITHLFFSNSFLLETAITKGVDIHMFDAIKKYENNNKVKSFDRLAARFTKPDIMRFLCGMDDSEGEYYPQVEFEIYKGFQGHKYMLSVLSGDCRMYGESSSEYQYAPEYFYAMIPFFKSEYLNGIQYLEEFNHLTEEEWNNLLLSITQNSGAIKCFEDTINYYNNSMVGSYISQYFSSLIEAVRTLQRETVANEKSFGKVLANSISPIKK